MRVRGEAGSVRQGDGAGAVRWLGEGEKHERGSLAAEGGPQVGSQGGPQVLASGSNRSLEGDENRRQVLLNCKSSREP